MDTAGTPPHDDASRHPTVTASQRVGASPMPAVAALDLFGTGAAWTALALTSPTTTWHLAPAVVAASAALTSRLRSDAPLPPRRAATLAAAGLAVSVIVALLLQVTGHLEGPTIIHRGSPLAESVLVAGLAAVWAWRASSRVQPTWWMRLLGARS